MLGKDIIRIDPHAVSANMKEWIEIKCKRNIFNTKQNHISTLNAFFITVFVTFYYTFFNNYGNAYLLDARLNILI